MPSLLVWELLVRDWADLGHASHVPTERKDDLGGRIEDLVRAPPDPGTTTPNLGRDSEVRRSPSEIIGCPSQVGGSSAEVPGPSSEMSGFALEGSDLTSRRSDSNRPGIRAELEPE
jgi:hypothetical protein